MSAVPTALDADRDVERLRKDGVSDAQAYAFARLLADVRCRRRFEREFAYQDLVRAGYSPNKADQLIKDALRGLGRQPP
jgi:hypothetical protein